LLRVEHRRVGQAVEQIRRRLHVRATGALGLEEGPLVAGFRLVLSRQRAIVHRTRHLAGRQAGKAGRQHGEHNRRRRENGVPEPLRLLGRLRIGIAHGKFSAGRIWFAQGRAVFYGIRTIGPSRRIPRRLLLSLDLPTFARGADELMASSSFTKRIRLILDRLEDRSVPTLLGQQLYPSDNPWNQRVDTAPVANNSAAVISNIINLSGVDGR